MKKAAYLNLSRDSELQASSRESLPFDKDEIRLISSGLRKGSLCLANKLPLNVTNKIIENEQNY